MTIGAAKQLAIRVVIGTFIWRVLCVSVMNVVPRVCGAIAIDILITVMAPVAKHAKFLSVISLITGLWRKFGRHCSDIGSQCVSIYLLPEQGQIWRTMGFVAV